MDRETILGIKDLDKHLAKYVEDKDVLNMIVNKKYLELFDEQFFHNLLLLKYPLLIRFKKDETWKNFYIKMVYYLSKLKEEFNFPYIPAIDYNPKLVYERLRRYPATVWNDGLKFAAIVGDMQLIEEMLSKGANPDFGLAGSVIRGDEKLIAYFISFGATSFGNALFYSAKYGHKDLIDTFLDFGAQPYHGLVGAAVGGNDEIFDYINTKYPGNLNRALLSSVPNSVRHLIQKGANNLNQALISHARSGFLKVVEILISEGATNIEEARDAAAINGKTAVVNYLNTLL